MTVLRFAVGILKYESLIQNPIRLVLSHIPLISYTNAPLQAGLIAGVYAGVYLAQHYDVRWSLFSGAIEARTCFSCRKFRIQAASPSVYRIGLTSAKRSDNAGGADIIAR